MTSNALKTAQKEWEELLGEFAEVEKVHENYCKEIEKVKELQSKCMSGIAHQRYRMKQILQDLKGESLSKEDEEQLKELKTSMDEQKACCRELEENLPHTNGIYLSIILGSVNVSLLSKHDKVADAAFQFLTVWYYCTLTIRESILKVNGSRIKGWWMTHHFISTVCAGIVLIWPDGYTYTQFRGQYLFFCIYLCMVSVGQFYYQRGMLYRLRSLGERHNMDITVEGFQSWMWRGLTFILPFLCGGYLLQLYSSYYLFFLSRNEKCIEWQVLASAFIFLLLFLGNSWTTFLVLRQKIGPGIWRQNMDFIVRNKLRLQNSLQKTMKAHDN
ncbi:DgyrCDS9549 [Dimorphilus gyrociliatus]|uniref:DgyrCDS9549 n=1 Tax=Dimorphilus gyrociliatus TaxID=2664684 RepID=A0A7I8VYZ0_9ANNE|nr:DgyrCDS9549 [Dimorphilus gyrociliatus]